MPPALVLVILIAVAGRSLDFPLLRGHEERATRGRRSDLIRPAERPMLSFACPCGRVIEYHFVLIHAMLARIARWAPRRNLVVAATFSLLFAVSDEYHQIFVPGRGSHWSDVAIDGIGISLAATIAWYRGATPVHERPPER